MLFFAPPPPIAPAYRGPPPESVLVFAGIAAVLFALLVVQKKAPKAEARWLPPPGSEKRNYEVWVLTYSVFWMGTFAVVIVFQLYEHLNAFGYLALCGGLATPLLLQPIIHPFRQGTGIKASHALRAQLWIAIFGFIGNYWYTHYFYCVLRARYTMPSWRLNDVPIAMYAATHFYFSSYHVLANLPLRRAMTTYAPGPMRTALQIALVLSMSYATAFMETLTISNFPYYDFDADRALIYTVGSAFYAIYFVVSFPVYFSLDEPRSWPPSPGVPLFEVAISSLAAGMLVLLLLDFTRLASVGVPLRIGGLLFEVTG